MTIVGFPSNECCVGNFPINRKTWANQNFLSFLVTENCFTRFEIAFFLANGEHFQNYHSDVLHGTAPLFNLPILHFCIRLPPMHQHCSLKDNNRLLANQNCSLVAVTFPDTSYLPFRIVYQCIQKVHTDKTGLQCFT